MDERYRRYALGQGDPRASGYGDARASPARDVKWDTYQARYQGQTDYQSPSRYGGDRLGDYGARDRAGALGQRSSPGYNDRMMRTQDMGYGNQSPSRYDRYGTMPQT